MRGGIERAPPAAARGAGASAARRSTSWRMILPLGPVPGISAISRPISFAMRLARGEANTRPPASGAGLKWEECLPDRGRSARGSRGRRALGGLTPTIGGMSCRLRRAVGFHQSRDVLVGLPNHRQHFADGHHLVGRHQDLAEHAAAHRFHFHVHFIGFDFDHGVAGGNGVAFLLEPLQDLALRHRIAALGHHYLNGHWEPSFCKCRSHESDFRSRNQCALLLTSDS